VYVCNVYVCMCECVNCTVYEYMRIYVRVWTHCAPIGYICVYMCVYVALIHTFYPLRRSCICAASLSAHNINFFSSTHTHTHTHTNAHTGLAWKKHVDVGAGVIDRDYTGNIGVVLFNHAQESLFIKVYRVCSM
jgi:hypothetical protein